MAKIVPFRGLYFNPEKVPDLSRVTAPPYDALTPQMFEGLCRRSPYNVAQLLRGHGIEDEQDRFSCYRKAARQFETWRQGRVLLREDEPVLYLCEQQYRSPAGQTVVRHGFIALTRIEDFASGVVKPHEATDAGAPTDRFQLIKECSANLSPVFSLYSDPCCVLEALSRHVREKSADMELSDDAGVVHRIWKVADPSLVGKIQNLLQDKPLLLADGHHRYETALAYRDFMREKYPDYVGREVFNYVMMFFSNMEAPGVRIAPIHRGVVLPKAFDAEEFIERLEPFFRIDKKRFDPEEPLQWEPIQQELAERGRDARVLALFAGGDTVVFLTLRDEEVMQGLFPSGTSRALRCLDVSILHKLILQRLLGLMEEDAGRDGTVHFFLDARQGLDAVRRGDWTLSFLLNPAELKDVRDIANAGEKMPPNSTFFYPRLLSGLVINPIEGRETVGG